MKQKLQTNTAYWFVPDSWASTGLMQSGPTCIGTVMSIGYDSFTLGLIYLEGQLNKVEGHSTKRKPCVV